jgi:cytoskeletal protein CcmA (bactofilin family)
MTTIGATLTINGELTSDEDLVLEGRVTGRILMRDAGVVVGPGAVIDADVRGTRVRVLGAVTGSIAASERIELATTATVVGSLSAALVVLEEGTSFNGRIEMEKRAIASKVAPFRAHSA